MHNRRLCRRAVSAWLGWCLSRSCIVCTRLTMGPQLLWNATRKPSPSFRTATFSVTLSDLAKYSVTWSIARSLCDSWASIVWLSNCVVVNFTVASWTCPVGFSRCYGSRQCMYKSMFCNRINNCRRGTDESKRICGMQCTRLDVCWRLSRV